MLISVKYGACFKKKVYFCSINTIHTAMPKVSVILPIYNVAPYLDDAFQSVLSQSLADIEVIAVNDGSTDNSQEVIDRYAAQDRRVMALGQENQGQSAARNHALSRATGKYIYMMDADDKLGNPDALRRCYEYAESNEADFVFFDGESFSEQGTLRSSWNFKRTHLAEENKRYDGEYLLNLMLDKQLHNCVVWLLFIRRTFLQRIGLTFYEGIIHEDELFTVMLTLQSNNVCCLRQSLVSHRVREASTMGRSYSRRNVDCYLTVADELLRFSQAPIIHKYIRYTLSKVFYTAHLIPFKDKPAVFMRAMRSGYMRYIGVWAALVFWLKHSKQLDN